jgi:Trypsin-like peptidase domain
MRRTHDGWNEDTTLDNNLVEDVELNGPSIPIDMPERDDPNSIERQPKPGTLPRPHITTTSAAAPSTAPVGNTGVLPYSATGKLFTRVSGGVGHGSAFVLGHRLVFTAAHCVDGGQAVEFVPGYLSDGSVRKWKMKFWFIHQAYLKAPGGDLRYDFAICITDPADAPIQPATGTLGWLSEPHGQADCVSIGYPMSPPTALGFDGNRMWQSRGGFLRSDAESLVPARNGMTRGCSGGPWVVNLGIAGGWRAVGLNSHVRSFDDQVMYSPAFDEDFVDMIEAAKKKEAEFNGLLKPGDAGYVRFV